MGFLETFLVVILLIFSAVLLFMIGAALVNTASLMRYVKLSKRFGEGVSANFLVSLLKAGVRIKREGSGFSVIMESDGPRVVKSFKTVAETDRFIKALAESENADY